MQNILQKLRGSERSRVLFVPVEQIAPNPEQPRQTFDEESLQSLAQSIRHNGILQPLTVRERGPGVYELVAGERRLRAAILAGYHEVPCIPVTLDDRQSAVMGLLENLQREDLNFFEEAAGIARLIEFCGLTQEEVAEKLGRSQPTVANKLRLLRIAPPQRERMLRAGLTERHARALLRLDEPRRSEALDEIIVRGYNVAETEELVENLLRVRQPAAARRNLSVIKDIRIFFNTINNAVGLMKRSGIEAESSSVEYEDHYEYTIRIPKHADRTA